jgi:hypothetical protein
MNRLPVYMAAFFLDALLRRMVTYALVLYGAEVLGGARWAGVLYFALLLPYLCSVHAGGVIDRARKRTVLQMATGTTALLMVGLFIVANSAMPSGAAVVTALCPPLPTRRSSRRCPQSQADNPRARQSS